MGSGCPGRAAAQFGQQIFFQVTAGDFQTAEAVAEEAVVGILHGHGRDYTQWPMIRPSPTHPLSLMPIHCGQRDGLPLPHPSLQ